MLPSQLRIMGANLSVVSLLRRHPLFLEHSIPAEAALPHPPDPSLLWISPCAHPTNGASSDHS